MSQKIGNGKQIAVYSDAGRRKPLFSSMLSVSEIATTQDTYYGWSRWQVARYVIK
jgi:hypothetical protein